jgi:hypothetical protein
VLANNHHVVDQGGTLSRIDRGTDARDDRARTRASSGSRRTSHLGRALRGRSRRNVAFLVLAMLLGATAVAVAGPSGGWNEGGLQATGGVVKFGPINPVNGFPDWYRDSNGEEVEACLSNFDPLCNAPLPAPNPDAQVSFPDNFPDEFFYFTGEASMTANGGNDVLALYTIEGTYEGGNTQTVFGRTRYRIRGGLQPGAEYTVTNPYGVDTLVAGDDATIFVTEDVGVGSGNFGGLFEGQVGPFLKWTGTDAPAGYLGDPGTPHAVTGSPFGTNFVKIEGPGVGGPANPNPCPGLDASSSPDCIYTDLFSILGKKSTKGGVDVARASYTLSGPDAKPQLDIMAESKADQDIVVQDTVSGAGRRFQVTPLEREAGRYFAHVDVQGTRPEKVQVVNRKDIPQTVKEIPVTDHVTGTALYNADTDTLHVAAASSDATLAKNLLTVTGFNKPLDAATGAVDITTVAPTSTVTVKSDRGGKAEIPVQVQGAGLPPLPLTALAGGDQTVEQGTQVTLDGSASTGNIDGYQWTGPAGVALTGAATSKATFTAPSTPGDYTFTLKVTGPDGTPPVVTSKEDTIVVHVSEVRNVEPRIAFANNLTSPTTPIAVDQNASVTLDGTQSVGASAFQWEKVRGPAVDLGTTDQGALTFTFPKTTQDLVLRLTVRNPTAVSSGRCTPTTCASVEVTLTPKADELTTTKARFVTNDSRWVIDGTATSIDRNRVTVYSGRALDPAMKIGTADVLADHTWSVDVRASTVPTTTCACVTAVSDRGGSIVALLEKPANLPPTTVDPGTPPATNVAAAGTAARAPLAAAVPLAGARIAPAVTGGALATRAVTAPATIRAASIATTGVPVTVNVPTGATLVRLRVLTTAGTPLLSTFKKVKGGTKVKVNIRSAKLRRKVRAGKRIVVEVRTGTAKNRLGKAVRKTVRVR